MSVFYMPVKVIDEPEAVRKNAALLKKYGRKAMIVTGRSSARKCGAYDDICAALEEQQIGHVLFDGVEENPSIDTVMKARDIGLSEGVDFVVGVGGGSPMDAAKAIALMIRHGGAGAEYLYDSTVSSDALPVVEIPTTCGTGSEVTAAAVITVPEKETKISIKHKIFPDLALIDGKYLKAAPVSVLCNTAVDALAHLIESEVNLKNNVYTHMCVDAGLKLWKSSLPVLRGEREAANEDRAHMLQASMMAGMAIAQGGTTLPHGLSYRLTYHKKTAHGKAVGYFTAGYLDAAAPEVRDYVLKTAGFTSLEDFQEFYLKVCGPVEAEDWVLLSAVDEISQNQAKLSAVPFHCDREILTRIAFYTKEHGG